MDHSLASSLWYALGIGSMLLIITSVIALIAIAAHSWYRVSREIEIALHDIDFSEMFPTERKD
jgi:hypothetical protein